MTRRQRGGPHSGHMIFGVVQLIFVGLATMILAVSSSVTTSTPQQGGIRAQLLHRDHPLSPATSPDDIGQAKRLQNGVRRSAAALSRNLANRRQLGSSTIDSPLYDGAPEGSLEYYMMISLGTPSQTFLVLLDTGSDLVWLQCAPCTNCNQSDPVFFPSLSSTYSQLGCSSSGCQNFTSQDPEYLDPSPGTCDSSTTCPYDYIYGTGFTRGNLSSDSITLTGTNGENVTVPDFWFGCSHNSSTFALGDGLVGMGQGVISFPSQLGTVFEDKFSYCLVNTSLSTVQSSLFVFGSDAGSGPISEALQYTPILRNAFYPSFYYVGLDGISVNGVALNFSAADVAINTDGSGGTVFDSGTTFTKLVPLVYDELLTKIAATVPKGYKAVTNVTAEASFDLCYNITGHPDFPSGFPSVSFKFADAGAWDLQFENSWVVGVLTVGGSDVEVTCLAFNRLADEYSGQNIFGNTQQQDFSVLYDRVNQKIGFAAADCGSMAA